MNDRFEVFWDWSEGGNAAHIAEHGVTPDEVDQVLNRSFEHREPDRSAPERFVVRGRTNTRRYLVVAFELEWVNELHGWVIIPVTAFEPEKE